MHASTVSARVGCSPDSKSACQLRVTGSSAKGATQKFPFPALLCTSSRLSSAVPPSRSSLILSFSSPRFAESVCATHRSPMISRLLAETPAAGTAAHARRGLLRSRISPARPFSTASILRATPATATTTAPRIAANASRGSHGWQLPAALSGSRLVSRTFSTNHSAHRIASSGPFTIPRRQSALQFYRTRRNNMVPRRGFAASAAPRFILHALRLPMGALTASLASLSYAQYKITGKVRMSRCPTVNCVFGPRH